MDRAWKRRLRLLAADSPELRELRETELIVGDTGAAAVARLLPASTHLRELWLPHCDIGATGARALGRALPLARALRTLGLRGNFLGNTGVAQLASGGGTLALTQLDLQSNGITADGGLALARLLHVAPALQTLCLSGNALDDQGLIALAAGAGQHATLQRLEMRSVGAGHDGTLALVQALAGRFVEPQVTLGLHDSAAMPPAVHGVQSGVLTGLFLHGMDLADDSLLALAAVLHDDPPLATLRLFASRLGTNGIAALCCALQGNTRLRSLDLSVAVHSRQPSVYAHIVADLAAMIAHNTGVATLNLRGIDLGGRDNAALLGTALAANASLTHLELQNNFQQDSESAQAVLCGLADNVSLVSITMDTFGIRDEHAAILADLVRRHPRLKGLHLPNNRLAAGGAVLLAAVASNHRITHVDLARNGITENDDNAFCRILHHRCARDTVTKYIRRKERKKEGRKEGRKEE